MVLGLIKLHNILRVKITILSNCLFKCLVFCQCGYRISGYIMHLRKESIYYMYNIKNFS